MNDERFLELLQASLLGDLAPDEESALDAELERRGPAGKRARRELAEALGTLALDAPPVVPPDRLRDRVLAAVEGSVGEAPIIPTRRRGRPPLAWTAAGIAAALALWLGVSNLRLRDRADRLTHEVEAAREARERI